MYSVQSGDTLAGIASALWGDASLWYKIAEANGLTADSPLLEGMSLIIPAGVQSNSNNATTFKPYDPLEVLGSTSPTSPAPKKNKCGAFGQILLAVIAIAVSVVAGPVAGSIVSQSVGVATGIQDKFSWNAVGLAWVSSFIAGPIGNAVGNAAAQAGASALTQAVVSATVSNVVTQGIGVATGMQKEFSWAGVAAAGVGAGVSLGVRAALPTQWSAASANFVARSASALANAATRSLIEGSDFGDNVIASLPDVLGQTIGEAIAGSMTGRGASRTGAPNTGKTPQTAGDAKTGSLGPDERGLFYLDQPDDAQPVIILENGGEQRGTERLTLGPIDPDADPLARLEREIELNRRLFDHIEDETQRIRQTAESRAERGESEVDRMQQERDRILGNAELVAVFEVSTADGVDAGQTVRFSSWGGAFILEYTADPSFPDEQYNLRSPRIWMPESGGGDTVRTTDRPRMTGPAPTRPVRAGRDISIVRDYVPVVGAATVQWSAHVDRVGDPISVGGYIQGERVDLDGGTLGISNVVMGGSTFTTVPYNARIGANTVWNPTITVTVVPTSLSNTPLTVRVYSAGLRD